MNYHSMKKEDIIDKFNSDINTGLTSKEALKRLEKNGLNQLPKKKKDSVFKIFFKEIFDPIVLLLLVTIFFCFIINEKLDAIAIIFIVFLDLIMGTFQEWRAGKNADSLRNLIKFKVKVIRDSIEMEIDSTTLVTGDIVLLESGDKISADIRILECNNLQVDESILTGESVNVYKVDHELDGELLLAERKNMVYAGTNVTTGRAKGLVVLTGINTEIGQIAVKVTTTKETKSPLAIRMDKLSKQISLLVIIIAIIIAIVLYIKGTSGSVIFLSVIALSVSAMPEGLPLALTMALTITSNQMAKKKVIVKKLNHVESLGSCTVIATDKTGTLTVNEQTAKLISLPNGKSYSVGGIGYNFDGKIDGLKENTTSIEKILNLGVLNNEAGISKSGKDYNYYGDSIDIAFLVLGHKANINVTDYEILKRIPYESENKYSAVFYKYKGNVYCAVKGSNEKVMEFCEKMEFDSKDISIDKKLLTKQNANLAKDGYRVISLAHGKVNNFEYKDYYDIKDIPKLTFQGMVSFIDPIRKEVKDSINDARKAGIKVVMITGDHPLTALSIAKELSLVTSDDEVCDGNLLNEYYLKGEKEFDSFVRGKRVFARVTPIDKLNIVNSLKRMGEFVAVTGDGVNDSPAIKSANIGISMGSGTDVCKETASMIIIDNNFKSIVSGIELGRCAYSNIRKVCYLLLSTGLAEVLFFLLSIICDLPMPLIAIQLLWLNLVTDGLQDLALSFEKPEKGIMNERPRNPNESIFDSKLLKETILSGLVIGITVFFVWAFLIKETNMNVFAARGYIMVLMVFMQNVHVFNCRSEKNSAFKISLKSNPLIIFSVIAAIVLQIIVMEVPTLSMLLETSTVPITHMVFLLIFSFVVLITMEIYKLFKYQEK